MAAFSADEDHRGPLVIAPAPLPKPPPPTPWLAAGWLLAAADLCLFEVEVVPVFSQPVKLSAMIVTARVRVVILFMCFPFDPKRAVMVR
jgi:hypothetical protein